MDEIEWLGGRDPTRMLAFLRDRASDRKLRYFACACCERIAHLFSGDSDHEAIRTVERFADGQGTQTELSALHIQMTTAALFEATGEDAAGAASSTSTVCAALQEALSLMRQLLRRNAIDDRIRLRRWGAELYEKPGYVR